MAVTPVVDHDEATCDIMLSQSRQLMKDAGYWAIGAFFNSQDPNQMARTETGWRQMGADVALPEALSWNDNIRRPMGAP